MKKIIYLSIFTFLILGCEKWNLTEVNILQLNTGQAEYPSLNQISITSEVTGIKSEFLIQHGHVWSESTDQPTILLNNGIDKIGGKDTDGNFTSLITDQELGKIYHVRSFAQTESNVSYGNSVTFSTGEILLATDSLEYLGGREAKLHGHLCCIDFDVSMDQYGFCWSSVNTLPTLENDQTINLGVPTMDGSFSGSIVGLEDNTIYYYRSYLITNFGSEIIYGEVKTWDAQLIDIWMSKSDVPDLGIRFPAFSFNGKGYVYASNRLWIYNPVSDNWTQSVGIPGNSFHAPATFVIGNYAYFMIGSDNVLLPGTECWRYDLINNQWEPLTPFEGQARSYAVAFAPGNGKAYAGLGAEEVNSLSGYLDFWEYDPDTDDWIQLDNYPGLSFGVNAFAFLDNGYGYIGGGWPPGGKQLYRFNHIDKSWELRNNLPEGDHYFTTNFTIDQIAYIGVGAIGGSFYSRGIWAYNSMEDSWIKKSDFGGQARSSGFGFVIEDKAYVGGGFNSLDGFLDDFWEYKATLD